MLTKVIIENFEVHKNTTIEFDSNLTLITGISRQGKSSILRAIKWVLTNQPSGDSFVSHNTDLTKVTLICNDNTTIIRERNKTKNKYTLNDNSYYAFSTTVPEDIQNYLNIHAINIQAQCDSYFLIDDSNVERVKKINEITGMSNIDISIYNIGQMRRHTEKILKFTREEYSKLRKEKRKYNTLEDTKLKLNKLELFKNNLSNLKNKLTKLQNIKQSLILENNKLKKYENVELLQKQINELLTTQNKTQDDKLAMQKYQKINNMFVQNKQLSNKFNTLSLTFKKHNALSDLNSFSKNTKIEFSKLKELSTKTINNNSTLDKTSIKIKQIEDTLYKEFPSICPICSTKISKELKDDFIINGRSSH